MALALKAFPIVVVMTVAVGLGGLAWLSLGPWPSLWTPLALALVIAYWTMGPVSLAVPAITFLVWCCQLLWGNGRMPLRSAVALGVLTLLTPAYLALSWRYGVEYQGLSHTALVTTINAVTLWILWALFLHARRVASFRASVGFHASLFAWLTWGAFPYLGELP